MKRRLNEIYVKHTSRLRGDRKTLDRDYFMTADQAKDFGLIDKVLKSREEVDGGAPRPSGLSRVPEATLDVCTAHRDWPRIRWPGAGSGYTCTSVAGLG